MPHFRIYTEHFEQGRLGSGMAVTLKDVALRAGVSRSAVSRTFTTGASVSSKTRKKIEKAVNELGYNPNFLARSLTTRQTKMIGLVSNNFHNPIFLQVFDLFTRGLQEHGLRPLLVNLSNQTKPTDSVKLLKQYSVDGVIVASSTLPSGFSKAFRDAGVPVVHSFGRVSEPPQVHIVGIDNQQCGRMAARCLIEKGYKSIGFMGGPKNSTSTQDRFHGFMEEAVKHPEIQASYSYADHYSFNAGRKEMLRLLKNGREDGYFCGDDVLSIGALSAIKTAGLCVPDDIGVIGLNDMEMAAWESINLTTIHQPVKKIISASIELMISMLADPDLLPEALIFPCRIVERGTLRKV
jgi:DNA-binding LacI/PurR family transcriptional regulator